MRAAILYKQGMLKTAEVPEPTVKEGGVLMEMKTAGICRTDLKMVQEGHRDLVLPRILGHEAVGEIVESHNPLFEEGDRVAVYPGIFCGKCLYCRSGHTSRCESIRIFGFNEDGFFRSLVSFGAEALSSLIPLPNGTYSEAIVFTEPLACCLNATRTVPESKGIGLIIGAGSVGSLFSALLLSRGWEQVVVADKDEKRLRAELPSNVKKVHAPTESLLSALSKAGLDQGVDFIAPCCVEGLNWPFWKVMRPGGVVSFFSGGVGGHTTLPIEMNAVHYRELSLVGSYGCNKADFVSASLMLSENRIDLSFFELCKIGLKEISEGMLRLMRSETKKVIIHQF